MSARDRTEYDRHVGKAALIDNGYLDEAPPPRRSGCSIFGWLALILVWVWW